MQGVYVNRRKNPNPSKKLTGHEEEVAQNKPGLTLAALLIQCCVVGAAAAAAAAGCAPAVRADVP